MNSILETYVTNMLAKRPRNLGEDIHHRIYQFHQFLIAIPKLLESLGLTLKYSFDGIDRVALLHLGREWMVKKFFATRLLVLAQGASQGGIED